MIWDADIWPYENSTLWKAWKHLVVSRRLAYGEDEITQWQVLAEKGYPEAGVKIQEDSVLERSVSLLSNKIIYF